MKDNGETIIEVNNLVRKFGDRAVLDELSFNVHRGETLVIMGGSGCGKSTLLRHMIGSMKPTSGSVRLFGEEITGMKEREIERVRLRFGMLFQSGALLASLTVGENVALPLLQHTNKSLDMARSWRKARRTKFETVQTLKCNNLSTVVPTDRFR